MKDSPLLDGDRNKSSWPAVNVKPEHGSGLEVAP